MLKRDTVLGQVPLKSAVGSPSSRHRAEALVGTFVRRLQKSLVSLVDVMLDAFEVVEVLIEACRCRQLTLPEVGGRVSLAAAGRPLLMLLVAGKGTRLDLASRALVLWLLRIADDGSAC